MKNLLYLLCMSAAFCFAAGCSGEKTSPVQDHVVMSLGKRVNSLDPVLAADSTSQYVIGAFYDTLLQYKYVKGTYLLEPAMLEAMPSVSQDGKSVRCRLRGDLFFQDAPPFAGKSRKVTASDVRFSILRLADPRLNSPGFWVIRDVFPGLDGFRKAAEAAPAGDLSPYDLPWPGFEIVNDREFILHLCNPNPRLTYSLALPYLAVVSRAAVEFYGQNEFAVNPCGSGPYRMIAWDQEYVLQMSRYDEFREEYFNGKRLPAADCITCYLVKQPLSSWLMFLQGELDFYALDGDNFEAVVNEKRELIPALRQRGIRLEQTPQLETNYIGFNFADPLLGSNADLRRAVTLAFDRHLRIVQSGGRFTEAYGPVPPGIPGTANADPDFGTMNLEKAREYMKKAGYPGGIDPKTGKPLVLAFDQTGSDTFYRQTAELMAGDLRKIGIEIKPGFNTRPRFFQKLSSGDVQMFRLSWTADYPDAENFLLLFYGPNAGASNRVSCRMPEFDRLYEEIRSMPDTPVRTEKYEKMVRLLQRECPWIWESHTMAFVLTHSWMKNYVPHDFGFNRWKYLSADVKERERVRKNFTPLSMQELRSGK